jgi:glycosyltransferase involved in cell wall biosynthesis
MRTKKIVFNCTTNIQGGTLQNAANFIISNLNNNSDLLKYFYLVSSGVHDLLKANNTLPDNLFVIINSPSKSIIARHQISQIVNEINPDLVFTMAGPSYVNFNSLHLMGCSNPYILFASAKDIFFGRNFLEFIFRYAHTKYQLYYIKKATHFMFQSNSSRDELSKKIYMQNTFVIPNAIGIPSQKKLLDNRVENKYFINDKYKILCPFAKYPHKGFHILPKIIRLLVKKNVNAHIIVTIDGSDILNSSKISDTAHISYIGEQKYNHMIDLYRESDVVFMPSVLEAFSSVCIEALYYQKPLIVADRLFNSDIVGDYAFYCDPYSIESCVDAIIKAKGFISNERYLINARNQVLSKFGFYSNRHESITNTIHTILE